MIDPPRWTAEELETAANIAVENFRRERLQEPLEEYLEVFDQYQCVVEEFFELTTDLTNLDTASATFAPDVRLLHVFRYLAGPPISEDDLKIVAEVRSINSSRLRQRPEDVQRIVDVIRLGLDRRRFPWLSEQRTPTELEVKEAVLATTSLMATQKVGTDRRSKGKKYQEGQVEGALTSVGFVKVPNRVIHTITDCPAIGTFCGESMLGPRKADFVVRLWDNRVMGIECKVSSSSTNSVKRLNNDAAVKAEEWRSAFGERGVVPAAVLSGVFKLHNLTHAQSRGLTILWAHNLRELTDWIESTRTNARS